MFMQPNDKHISYFYIDSYMYIKLFSIHEI